MGGRQQRQRPARRRQRRATRSLAAQAALGSRSHGPRRRGRRRWRQRLWLCRAERQCSQFNAGMAEGGLGSVQRAAAHGLGAAGVELQPARLEQEGRGRRDHPMASRPAARPCGLAASRGESGMGSPRTQGLFFALEAQGKMRGSDESRGSRRFLSAGVCRVRRAALYTAIFAGAIPALGTVMREPGRTRSISLRKRSRRPEPRPCNFRGNYDKVESGGRRDDQLGLARRQLERQCHRARQRSRRQRRPRTRLRPRGRSGPPSTAARATAAAPSRMQASPAA